MASEEAQVEVGIARIYLKDLSFESPGAPEIFSKTFQPEVKVRVSVKPRKVQDGLYEVALELHIEGIAGETIGFIVEVEQAGLFEIRNASGAQLDNILQVFCPATIFPYSRQIVDAAMINGGFPPLLMGPLDFESLRRANNDNANLS